MDRTTTHNDDLVPDKAIEAEVRRTMGRVYRRTDRLFLYLMPFQWAVAVVLALAVAPTTWAGGPVTAHVLGSIVLATAFTVVPIVAIRRWPGTVLTRHAVAACELSMSALLIHVTGGRIETHFHIFGALAFVAAYQDWRVLVTATVVVAIDHLVRGVHFPRSIFGAVDPAPGLVIEHVFYVLFQDTILWVVIDKFCRDAQHRARQSARVMKLAQALAEEKALTEQRILEATRASEKDRLSWQVKDVLDGIQTMARSIEQNSDSSAHLAVRAATSAAFARDGGDVVKQAIHKIHGLADVVGRAVATIQRLEASSAEIGKVTTLIRGVAFETHILALNAAVEAARAGEHGRGFAVVADEVRSLAARTADATQRIEAIATDIQTEANGVIRIIQAGADEVEHGLTLADAAERALQRIVESTREMIELVDGFTAATEQQSAQSAVLARQVESLPG
jgi:methyl-accepting chemotaxis protein